VVEIWPTPDDSTDGWMAMAVVIMEDVDVENVGQDVAAES